MSALSFFKTTISDLISVGAVVPSSAFTIKRTLEALPAGVKTIVEYGPGDGIITKHLLDKLPPDGKLLAIELNKEFAEKMKEIRDPRLVVVEGDAVNVSAMLKKYGLGPVDAVVCGIPFTVNYFSISNKTKKEIMKTTHGILRTGGIITMYQSSLLMMPFLKEYFSVDYVFEPRNLPPYFIIHAERKD